MTQIHTIHHCTKIQPHGLVSRYLEPAGRHLTERWTGTKPIFTYCYSKEGRRVESGTLVSVISIGESPKA